MSPDAAPAALLDHVTLRVADLDAAAAFYERLLGLERGEARTRPDPGNKLWLFDGAGRAPLHLARAEAEAGGAVDHLAFAVAALEPFAARAAALATPAERRCFPASGIEQLVVSGPHGVRIELSASRG